MGVDKKRTKLLKAFAFQTAHQYARRVFQREFMVDSSDDVFTDAVKKILKESEEQENLASEVIKATGEKELEVFVSHYASVILLNKCARLIQKHNRMGLIRDQEAHGFLEEIDNATKEIHECSLNHEKDMRVRKVEVAPELTMSV